MMRFSHGEATDVGQIRQVNEDGYLVAAPLFAVADGMGGHRAGEVASATALETLRLSVSELSADALMGGVEQANLEVFRRAMHDPDLHGMGTTLCAIAPVIDEAGERIGIVNVGDSRIYVHTGERLTQITEDHSLVEAMVRVGQLSPEQAAAHPKRNVVTRALGIEPTVDVDCWALIPAQGDRILLCSDGLFGEVDDGTIEGVLGRETDPAAAAEELVRLANLAGGRDNITVVVVDLEMDETPTATGAVPLAERVERLSAPTDDLALLGESVVEPVPASPYLPGGAADAVSGSGSGNGSGRGTGDGDGDGTADGDGDSLVGASSDTAGDEVGGAAIAGAVLPPTAAPEPSRPGGTHRTSSSPRVTWRVLVFVGVVLVVVAVAVAAFLLTAEEESPSITVPPATSMVTTTDVTTTAVTSTAVSTTSEPAASPSTSEVAATPTGG